MLNCKLYDLKYIHKYCFITQLIQVIKHQQQKCYFVVTLSSLSAEKSGLDTHDVQIKKLRPVLVL